MQRSRPPGRAAPDWASKIHLAVAPVYYQSYLLGELLASQLDRAVRDHAGGFVARVVSSAIKPSIEPTIIPVKSYCRPSRDQPEQGDDQARET